MNFNARKSVLRYCFTEGHKVIVVAIKDADSAVVWISSNSASLENKQEEACKATDTIEGNMAYSGSKQAVARWMRRNTADYPAAGVRMNAVAPG